MNVRHYPDSLAPLAPWLNDPHVVEIMVNGYDSVFLEREGRLVQVETPFRDDEHLVAVIDALLALSGREVNESCPLADVQLFDDARANVVIPPISVLGPSLVIRKFMQQPLSEADLLRTLARWTPDKIEDALAELEAGGRAQVVTRYGKRFWTSAAAYFPDRESGRSAGSMQCCRGGGTDPC